MKLRNQLVILSQSIFLQSTVCKMHAEHPLERVSLPLKMAEILALIQCQDNSFYKDFLFMCIWWTTTYDLFCCMCGFSWSGNAD